MKKVATGIIFALCVMFGFGTTNLLAETNKIVTSGLVSDDISYTLYDDGLMVIEGNGDMKDYGISISAPWSYYGYSIKKVVIKDGITSVGDYAFRSCDSLTEVEFADSVESIGAFAFECCDSLDNLIIPEGVKFLAAGAFYECNGIVNVTLPESLTTIGSGAFKGCYSLMRIEIPDNVIDIGGGAFEECHNLMRVTMGKKVTSIGNSAFSNCTNLETITLSDSLITIGGYAFYNCANIENLKIPEGVAEIKEYAFYGCRKLNNVTIPEAAVSIGKYAFYNCDSFTEIKLNNNLESIGDGAFFDCDKMEKVNIPSSVKTIGDNGFGCSYKLKSVYIDNLSTWCKIDFKTTTSNPLNNGADLYLNDKILEDLVIPKDITNIKAYAFVNGKSIKSVELHDGVKTVYGKAFFCCSNIEEIYIGKGLLTVVANAFGNCTGVYNVYYEGNETDWENVVIGSGNDCLTNGDNITYEEEKVRVYTFVTNGGSEVEDIESEITEEPLSQKEGYSFLGWYDNEACEGKAIEFPYMGTKLTLYAKWWKIGEDIRGIEYIINSITIKDAASYEIISEIPDKSFIAEVSVTNVCSEKTDMVIIATYDANNSVTGIYFMYASIDVGETLTFGSLITNNSNVDKIRVFVRPDLKRLTPLAESVEL